MRSLKKYKQVEFDIILRYNICHNLIDLKFTDFKCSNNCFYHLCNPSFNIRLFHCAIIDSYDH